MVLKSQIQFDYADVGDVRLHYAKAGAGERLVVLLHGFPEFWYSWRVQIAALSGTYTVVAPDLRGYNLSDRPTDRADYSVDKLVADVVGLIDHFGMGPVALIGHDWGAAIAWAVAAKHPDKLWKLGALQVPPTAVWKRNQTVKQFLASWYMFFFQLPGLPEFLLKSNDFALLARSMRTSTARPDVFSDADIAEYKTAWSRPGAPTAMLNYYRANILGRLFGKKTLPQKIDLPTLFIYGEKDMAVLPATVAGVGEIVSGRYTEHRIPDSGHWVQQEASDEVTRVIRGFLAL